MKHTGKFWLNCLPGKVREKWSNNYDPHFSCNYIKYEISLSDFLKLEMDYETFIIEAFNWGLSPEGGDYWQKIYVIDEKKLIRNYKLKQLGI